MEETNNMMNSEQEQKLEDTNLPKNEVNEETSTETSKGTVAKESDKESGNQSVETEENNCLETKVDEETQEELEETSNEDSVIPDFNKLSLEALVAEANKVVNSYEFGKSKKIIDIIKNTFYTKLNHHGFQ